MGIQERAIVVVGGGLAGLTAAALCAGRGRRVLLFEKSSSLGGRAGTREEAGYRFNFGAHALYVAGRVPPILRELGVTWTGAAPRLGAGKALRSRALHPLPMRAGDFVSTSLLDVSGKVGFARLFGLLAMGGGAPDPECSLEQWLAANLRSPLARELFRAFVRLSTFHHMPDRMSAVRAVAQVRLGMGGVEYIDGGWQTLVDGVHAAARRAGVEIRTGARVSAIDYGERVRAVVLDDGTRIEARAVVVAASPAHTSALTGDRIELLRRCSSLGEVRAACLDVGLSRLPQPKTTFVLGIDEPVYFSVHSDVAAGLAPQGGALVSTLEYLDPDAPFDAEAVERRLEGLLDIVQPGWRAFVAARQFLPRMTVMHAPARLGRPVLAADGSVPGVGGLFVAGDWVGTDAMLLDASLESARRAASGAIRGTAAAGVLSVGLSA